MSSRNLLCISFGIEDVFQAPSQIVTILTELLRTFQCNCIGFRTFPHSSTELLRTFRQMALRLEDTVAIALTVDRTFAHVSLHKENYIAF